MNPRKPPRYVLGVLLYIATVGLQVAIMVAAVLAIGWLLHWAFH